MAWTPARTPNRRHHARVRQSHHEDARGGNARRHGGVVPVWAQGEWKAPAEAKATKNPEKGVGCAKMVIDQNCVPCHGTSHKGDGPAAAALPTKPADWTSDKVQKETDGEIFWKISNGRGPMPPWKHL